MATTFKSKAQQFVSDVVTDVRQNGHVPSLTTKLTPSSGTVAKKDDRAEPHVYREESRLAEHGKKCIDPDTGLIYFKYDFGYEFGVVLPGEGGKPGSSQAAKVTTSSKRSERDDGSVDFPIIHEKSAKGTKPDQKWAPVKWSEFATSESELSDADEARKTAGRSTDPKITFPPSPCPILAGSPNPSPHITSSHDFQGYPFINPNKLNPQTQLNLQTPLTTSTYQLNSQTQYRMAPTTIFTNGVAGGGVQSIDSNTNETRKRLTSWQSRAIQSSQRKFQNTMIH
ncbi:unnamed protein product, partial [Nesidiocoris tenuis]